MGAIAEKPTEPWIYDQIFAAILEHRLLPDTKLTERELCDIFGVSRTIVRKVLLRLSLDHVVELRPNRGAVIATPVPDEVREIFDARRLLEDGTVAEACRRCTDADARALRRIVAREKAAVANDDVGNAIRLSGDFHVRVARIAGNRPLAELLRQLVAQTSLAIARYMPAGPGMCEDDDHERLIAAIEEGDVAESRRIMRVHLTHCERQLRLDKPKEAGDLRTVFADVVTARRAS